jgi:hypothetical protein
VGLGTGLNGVEMRKVLLLQGLEIRPLVVQPVAIPTALSQLKYKKKNIFVKFLLV